MENKRITISTEAFRSAWIPAAAVCCALAALVGGAAVVSLLLPNAKEVLIADMMLGGITDRQALQSWAFLQSALTVASFLIAVAVTVLFAAILAKRAGRVLLALCSVTEKLIQVLNVCAVGLLVVFIYKAVRYILVCFSDYDNGMYMLFSFILFEGIMFTFACLAFKGLKRFLNSVCDSAASIAYTLESKTVGAGAIPALSANGLLFLAAANLLVAADRLFTVTIVPDLIQDYYALIPTDQPLLALSGTAFLLSAAGCFSTGMYLRKFKKTSERLYHLTDQK